MAIIDLIREGLPEGRLLDVSAGPSWSFVEVEVGGVRRAGLASRPDGPDAAPPDSLAELIAHAGDPRSPALSSFGVAAVNALLPPPENYDERNAEAELAEIGAERFVTMVGHFRFAEGLRARVGRLEVIERDPRPGDHPESAAAELLPQSDVVAITAMTVVNGSLDGLLALCPPEATVMLLGPSTPLSPRLFDAGVDVLAGAVIVDVDAVRRAVPAARRFRQIEKAGVRLVSIRR